MVAGTWHKLCSGPAHEEPEWLPATQKYYYLRKTGRFSSQCRLCHVWTKVKNPGSHHGYIDIRIARPYYEEAVNRIGMTELSERTGLSLHHIQIVFNKRNKKFVRKLSLRKVMLELVSIHRKNEYIDNPRVRWQTERRNNNGLSTCGGCGTPKANFTKGCESCSDRLRALLRNKRISPKEYDCLKAENFA